jgi:hypothetical protein
MKRSRISPMPSHLILLNMAIISALQITVSAVVLSGGWSSVVSGVVRRVVPQATPEASLITQSTCRTRAPLTDSLDSYSPLFASKVVDVQSVSPSASARRDTFDAIRPYASEMPITKNSRSAAAALVESGGGLQGLTIPGKMLSAPLYIIDVMVLPRENSLAIMCLDSKAAAAATTANASFAGTLTSTVEEALTNLPIAFLGQEHEHELKCGIVKPNIKDQNCEGGSQVLLCRAIGVDITDELRKASKTSSQVLAVQMGSEIVNVSARTLSAMTAGQWTSRVYHNDEEQHPKGQQADHELTASVVVPLFGETPLYLAETMAYFEQSGMRHVYFGLFHQKAPGEVRRQLEPFVSKGLVTILETDDWPGLHFDPYLLRAGLTGAELWLTIMNDWALYHTKSWDDLLLVHDYDELMVPTLGETVPNVVKRLLRDDGVSLQDMCFFVVCPVVTYGELRRPVSKRGGVSRAEDFPFMDGGNKSQGAPVSHGNSLFDFCTEGGYQNMYPKSIAVVETSYKTTLHYPGACSARTKDPLNGEFVGLHKKISRNMGLIVQHVSELRNTGRYVPTKNDREASAFSKVWGPKLKRQSSSTAH